MDKLTMGYLGIPTCLHSIPRLSIILSKIMGGMYDSGSKGSSTLKGFKQPMNTKTALAIVLILGIAITSFARSNSSDLIPDSISYQQLLAESIEQHKDGTKFDEVQEALRLINANASQLAPAQITDAIKHGLPAIDANAKIRVLPEMREALILKGDQYDRLTTAVAPILKLYQLEGKVLPLLYKSEQPVAALIYPNALVFSTRQLDLLNDNEIEALAAHELPHLIANSLFRKAIDDKNKSAIRTIEFFCDATAAATLEVLQKNPHSLIDAL